MCFFFQIPKVYVTSLDLSLDLDIIFAHMEDQTKKKNFIMVQSDSICRRLNSKVVGMVPSSIGQTLREREKLIVRFYYYFFSSIHCFQKTTHRVAKRRHCVAKD